jgi:Putative Flp pilus-assembly TadE/G-like
MNRRVTLQSGQAMVLGLALLMFSAIGVVLVFNTSQVTSTKQRLTNAADAAAYSAATYRARVLNYIAYSNRAIVANEVASAQAVTLASWAQYVETTAETIDDLANIFPYIKPYTSYIASLAEYLSEWTDYVTEVELQSRAAETYGYKTLLAYSQELLERTVDVFGMNMVAFEVAKANDPRFMGFTLNTSTMFGGFSKQYSSDEERQRLAAVVKRTLALDPFTGSPRNTDFVMWGLPTSCVPFMSGNLPYGMQALSRRGGTFLTEDLNRWEAADTLSHVSARMRGVLSRCRQFEVYPFGYGGGEASSEGSEQQIKNEYAGYDLRRNSNAMSEVEDSDMRSYDSYSGIEKVRELDYEAIRDRNLEGEDRYPVLEIAAVVRMSETHLPTAENKNLVSGQLRSVTRNEGGHLGSLAVAKVYFRRPSTAGRQEELASLYNPYWQVRMGPASATQRLLADAYMHLKN